MNDLDPSALIENFINNGENDVNMQAVKDMMSKFGIKWNAAFDLYTEELIKKHTQQEDSKNQEQQSNDENDESTIADMDTNTTKPKTPKTPKNIKKADIFKSTSKKSTSKKSTSKKSTSKKSKRAPTYIGLHGYGLWGWYLGLKRGRDKEVFLQ
eukprot:66333_1